MNSAQRRRRLRRWAQEVAIFQQLQISHRKDYASSKFQLCLPKMGDFICPKFRIFGRKSADKNYPAGWNVRDPYHDATALRRSRSTTVTWILRSLIKKILSVALRMRFSVEDKSTLVMPQMSHKKLKTRPGSIALCLSHVCINVMLNYVITGSNSSCSSSSSSGCLSLTNRRPADVVKHLFY